jgi:hypothetical protein
MREDDWLNLYSIGGYVFSITGCDAELHEMANAVYSGARVAAGTAGITFRISRIEESAAHVYCMSVGGGEVCRQRSLSDFFLDVESILTQQAMSGCRSLMQVHAGAVAIGGAGVLICGPPESGKTSLVVGLAGHGATILTDEVGLLQRDATVPTAAAAAISLVAFSRDLTVHKRTQRLFPLAAYAQEPSFKRFPDRCHVSPQKLAKSLEPPDPTPLRQLLFTSFQPGRRLSLERLGPAEAARRLLLDTCNLESPEGCIELIAGVVESSPAWEVLFGDAAEASSFLATFITDANRS